jgi:TolA-binding protein
MHRVSLRSALAILGLGLGLAVAASPASAQSNACIADSAKQALASCPGGAKGAFDVSKHGKKPKVNFQSAPPPADLKKRDQQTKPSVPMDAPPRDERKSRLQARARALLVTEIQGLENLFKTTPQNSPDRPTLARRLAEDYVELESAAFRDKTTAEMERDNLKKTNPQAAGQKQAIANQANGIMLAARKKAIDYYTLIKNQYPNYGQLDEVLYYLAYEYEQANDNANARKVYYELIQKKPDSKYIPNAYLAFGELFFNEAMGDPSKWETAEKAYIEVIKFPPEKSKVYGYAWYKLAYVFWNKGEFDKALNSFKKCIDYGVAYSQHPNATKLAETARRDIIPVYALKGDPGAAYNFFKGVSGDTAGKNDKTFKMMEDLGNNYLDTGHYNEAVTLFKDLMVRNKGSEKSCVYQGHITEAVLAMKSGNKDAIKSELDNQLKVYADFKSANHPEQAKLECANKTAELVAETAMAWHLEAVGSQGQRGTGDNKTMTLAAYLYKKVVDNFTKEEFAKFQFPRIVKDDWPTIYKIKYAMADLLYFQKRWAECGPAFDSVVEEDPNSPEAAEAAYASVLCYQNIYEATHQGDAAKKGIGNLPGQKKGDKVDKKAQEAAEKAKLKPKDLTDNQKGMIQAFNRYICYIKPPPNDTAGQEQLVEVKYARARTYFEAQHWEEAGMAFREIAMEHSDRDVGIYAAQLYLESVNVLGAQLDPPRPACFDDMAADVPKFIDLYCTGEKAKKNDEQCNILTRIQSDILRLKNQKLVECADKGSCAGMTTLTAYEQAGSGYLDLFRKYCQAPMDAGQQPQAEKCEELVYNAARAFQAARLIAKAIAARMILLNPKYKLDKTPLAKKAVYEIGGNYQAIAVYDQAADWYERYAKEDKSAEKADQALSDAVVLRLGLGDEQKAIEDADLFRRNYGASKPKQAAAIAFAIGAHYVEKEDWKKAQDALKGSMPLIDKAGLDVQVQAHAALARAYLKQKGDQGAKAEYQRVRDLWKDPKAAVAKINDAYPDEDEGQKLKRLAKALNAVGEAYFYNADEVKRTTVDTIKFPVYNGSGATADVKKHIDTKVKDWLEKKKAAIEKVEVEYKKIVDLQPEPPPRWVIAAGSRTGLLWGDFVDEFRRSPYPKDWDKKGCAIGCGTADQLDWAEIKARYFASLDEKSEPIKTQRAKPALVTCLTYSVKFQYFDEFSRACEVWLAKNYKAEYHVVDELRGAPTLTSSGLDDKAPPLLVGGAMWHPPAPEQPKAPAAADDKKDDKDGGKPAGKK